MAVCPLSILIKLNSGMIITTPSPHNRECTFLRYKSSQAGMRPSSDISPFGKHYISYIGKIFSYILHIYIYT